MTLMKRLLVHVEGETEERFVHELLAPHLANHGYVDVSARKLGNARQRHKRHGIKPWAVVKDVICGHLTQDRSCYATLMVDYYAMPSSGDRLWPGREDANSLAHANKAAHIQSLLHADIQLAMPHGAQRFVPFVQMHEFESLLFSDCSAGAQGLYQPEIEEALQEIRRQFDNPECINDSPETAPSKRLAKIIPKYEDQKPYLGTLGALAVGINAMRQECPGFAEWLHRLEQLPSLTTV